jgi:hypothetical protein
MAMWTQIIAALAVLTLGSPAISAAQTSKSGDTYEWSAELVSIDPGNSTLTLKPRVAYPEAVSELKQFKLGERVWVVWSGIHEYSDAVRQVRRAEAGNKITEDLVLPAEFVSAEPPNAYVTIRIKAPASALAAVKGVKPSEWVTVTSRHRPSTDAEAVVAVKPYAATTQ